MWSERGREEQGWGQNVPLSTGKEGDVSMEDCRAEALRGDFDDEGSLDMEEGKSGTQLDANAGAQESGPGWRC